MSDGDFECNPIGTMRLIDDLRGEIRALQLTEENLRRELVTTAGPDDSYLKNCCVIQRQPADGWLFWGDNIGGNRNRVFARLDRYTIVPTEQLPDNWQAAPVQS